MQIGIIGISGFAGTHHRTVSALQKEGVARLVCTCDPRGEEAIDGDDPLGFRARGVEVYKDYLSMLNAHAAGLDVVVIPTPIPLHNVMHQAAVERGVPVYLEKPPTLDPMELEEMIARDAGAKRATMVGFNHLVQPTRQRLKQRLLAGEFGEIEGAALWARWARSRQYFERNNWAGRLCLGDQMVLDSCLGNAMSHLLHHLLFWCGRDTLFSWGALDTVQAELYRVHQIEGFDTVYGQARMNSSTPLRFALSHGGTEEAHEEMVICGKARIRFVNSDRAEVLWNDGRAETFPLENFDNVRENHLAYFRYLRGETDRPITTLQDTRSFVWLNALAYVSSGTITPVPAENRRMIQRDNQAFLEIKDLKERQEAFLLNGAWPGDWGRDGRRSAETVHPADLALLRSTVRSMAWPVEALE